MSHFKPYTKSNNCRLCIFRQKSNSPEMVGSVRDGTTLYFVMNGIQWNCNEECKQ